MPTLSALILAGGYSRRMGTDKALLPLSHNQPMLLRTAQIAQQIATDVAVVTPWPSRYRSLLSTTEVRLVQEPTTARCLDSGSAEKPSAGPLSGFAYGWQHITSDWCLLLACDLPYLDAVRLNQWWSWTVSAVSHDVMETGLDGAYPMASLAAGANGWEPLCGFYHRSCLPSLTRQLATAQRAFQPWLQRLTIARYDDIAPQMFFNCNTPAEWRAVIGD